MGGYHRTLWHGVLNRNRGSTEDQREPYSVLELRIELGSNMEPLFGKELSTTDCNGAVLNTDDVRTARTICHASRNAVTRVRRPFAGRVAVFHQVKLKSCQRTRAHGYLLHLLGQSVEVIASHLVTVNLLGDATARGVVGVGRRVQRRWAGPTRSVVLLDNAREPVVFAPLVIPLDVVRGVATVLGVAAVVVIDLNLTFGEANGTGTLVQKIAVVGEGTTHNEADTEKLDSERDRLMRAARLA